MNKLKIVQIISFIVLVVLLYFSTYIIVYIYNDVSNTNINKIENFKLYEKDDVIYKIENIFVSNNLLKTITIQGYSFVENEFDDTNKKLYAYLISDKYCYKITSNITVHFQHYNLKKQGYKIFGNNIGFNIEFSGLNLNNGEYKLYIEDIENEKKYGITYAEYKIIVTDKNIKILKDEFHGINKIIDEFNTSTNFKFSHNIEKIEKVDDAECKIFGWAYNSKEKEPVTIYVGLADDDGNETYWTTEKYARPDVAKFFQDKNLLNTGYRTVIKMDNTSSCTLSSLIARYENKYYKYSLNEDGVIYSKVITIAPTLLNQSPINVYIEKSKKEKKSLIIEGWAYLKNLSKSGPVYVGMKDKTGKETYYIAEPIERPDVVKHFNNADLLKSGFQANIKIGNDAEFFSSIIIQYNDKYYIQPININPIVELEKDKIIEDNALDLYVEKNEQQNNALFIEGWAYLKDINKTGKIYIGLKDNSGKEIYYTTTQIERPDVVKHFNNNDNLLNSGFKADISLENKESYEFSSIIIEYDGKYYRKAVK